MSYYTENMGEFGYREIKELSKILNAWVENGLPIDFHQEEVKPAFNKNSGYVFLVNNEYQVCMLNGDKLDIWHTLPYSGEEGFLCDLLELDSDSLHQDDVDYINAYKEVTA
jgi:hypothetical protein